MFLVNDYLKANVYIYIDNGGDKFVLWTKGAIVYIYIYIYLVEIPRAFV